jgi:transposase
MKERFHHRSHLGRPGSSRQLDRLHNGRIVIFRLVTRVKIGHIRIGGPKAIGIDEISIRKGHSYRIVVSDLIRRRPIWFGGGDRSEASMA